MSAFIAVFLVAACMLPDVFAQLKIDTLRLEVTNLPVIRTLTVRNNADGTGWEEVTDGKRVFKSWSLVEGDSMDADTMVFKMFGHPYFRLHFNEDSTKLSAFHRLGGELEELTFDHADFAVTPRAIEVQMDSAALLAFKFTYQSPYWWTDTTGASRYSGEVFSGAPTNKTKVKITYVKSSTSDVAPASLSETLTMFPNPAKDLLNVRVPVIDEVVTIYDFLGREVLRTNIHGEAQIKVSSLVPGVYVLRCGNESRKLVIE